VSVWVQLVRSRRTTNLDWPADPEWKKWIAICSFSIGAVMAISTGHTMVLEDLPDELLCHIASMLKVNELSPLPRVWRVINCIEIIEMKLKQESELGLRDTAHQCKEILKKITKGSMDDDRPKHGSISTFVEISRMMKKYYPDMLDEDSVPFSWHIIAGRAGTKHEQNRCEALKILLKDGILDPAVEDSMRMTPLMHAVRAGCVQCCLHLLETGMRCCCCIVCKLKWQLSIFLSLVK